MNNTIKELAEKSFADAYRICKECDHTVGETDSIFVSLAVSKFAELIVEGCALTLESITVPVFESVEDWDKGYNKALATGAEVIREQFGVK